MYQEKLQQQIKEVTEKMPELLKGLKSWDGQPVTIEIIFVAKSGRTKKIFSKKLLPFFSH